MNRNIPVTRSFLPPFSEYAKELESIWDTHWLTNQGPLHQRLEADLKVFLGIPNVTLFTNGHLALDVAIKALGIDGEVITTPFTFASTTHAITMNGINPIFCDIKPDDFTIDESLIEGLITPRTSAIVAVHVYGNPCAVQKIDDIAMRYGLKVIYDSAHAFGERINGRPITDFGDVSMYSFHATKVFHTIEGGALVYNNSGYSHKFDLYKNFGITGPETVEAIGLNAKMNEFQAAMGIVNLRYLNEEIARRKSVAMRYRTLLAGVPGISFPSLRKDVEYNYSYFPILINPEEFGMDRDRLFMELGKSGVFPRKYFYPLIVDFDCYRADHANDALPIARIIAANVLTLPLYGSLSEEDTEFICTKIAGIAVPYSIR